ncbi:MAG TPA: redoxin domain-containing protein [Solirubrobacteraceae bacterium]|jgi:peroxiredoxin (alkyl hydroperoxide reductase subunit C)
MSVLPAGTPAPSFTLARADGEPFTERDLQGRTTVLVFYPFAFSPVCTDQLQLYEPLTKELAGRADALYGVSCDSSWAQSAFKDKLAVSSEQLSDFEPKGAACAAFGVLHDGGFAQRALVITGPDGVVRWSYQADSPGDLPGVELLRDALAGLR